MNIKAFFVAALQSALDLGIATPDDVIRHVTPDVLANHLPRPLWARVLTACLGAPRVDAQLVVETVGVPNLCEHIPSTIVWSCIEEIGARSLGQTYIPRPIETTAVSAPIPVVTPMTPPIGTPTPLSMAPPPDVIVPVTATQPTPTIAAPEIPVPPPPSGDIANLFSADSPEDRPSSRSRPSTQRFRQGSTGIGRLAGSSRRPQAAASAPPPTSRPSDEYEVITDVAGNAAYRPEEKPTSDDWKANLAVEDEQLVDWGADETMAGATDDDRRKR